MRKQAPTAGRLLVMAAFAVSCLGLLLFLWLAFGGATPLAAKGYRFTIPFREAGQLALEADVRISGVRVGKVKSIELGQYGRTTDAIVELEERYAPIPKDSRAILRQKTLLGETYVEIAPGASGRRNPVPEGGRLRGSRVDESVELDEIFRALDPRTRADFQVWMERLSQSVNGRGRDLSDAIGNFAPMVQDTTDLLTVLNSQQGAVRGLISNTGEVFEALSERDGQLRSLIEGANRVFATTAARDAELRQIFEILPTFESEATTSLRRLDAFSRETDPLISRLRPAARQLSPTLLALEALAPDLKGLFRDLRPLIDAARRGLPATDELLDDLEPLLGQLDPWLRQVNPVLEEVGLYPDELNAFFANTVAATQATNNPPGGTSTRLHYLRTTNPINPENLALYPRRVGSNRANPYYFPAAFRGLAKGLPVFEDRQCGNGVPTLLSTTAIADAVSGAVALPPGLLPPGLLPSQLGEVFPPQLRALVEQFVFRGTSVIPAPPCRKQGPFRSLGKGSTRVSDYPRVFPDPRPRGR